MGRREGVFRGPEPATIAEQVAQQGVLPGILRRRVAEKVLPPPSHPVVVANEVLEVAVRQPRGALELRGEGRGSPGVVGDEMRIPARTGDIRGRVRRKLTRVYRDVESAVLKEPGGREADNATAEHGSHAGAAALADLVGGEVRGAPGERDATPAVPVVVDEQLVVAEWLGVDAEAGRTKRPEPHDGADDPFGGDQHALEPVSRITATIQCVRL